MSGPERESPPALGAEGQAMAVGAIAGLLYADGRATGNPNGDWLAVPRAAIEHAASAMIDWLNMTDGDADSEDADPAEHNGDERDGAWPEWHTMRGSQKRGQNITAGHEDDELDDAPEDDDPDSEHDGREPESDL